jgi:hypothetical protein
MIAETANLAAGSGVVKEGVATEPDARVIKQKGQAPVLEIEMIRWEQSQSAGCLTGRLSGKRQRARSFKLPAYGSTE